MAFKVACVLVFALVFLSATAYGADCYSEGIHRPCLLSRSQYYSAADRMCSGASTQLEYRIGSCKLQFTYSGNARKYCKDAYYNIIDQCIQGGSRVGGTWNWNSGSENAHFTLRGSTV